MVYLIQRIKTMLLKSRLFAAISLFQVSVRDVEPVPQRWFLDQDIQRRLGRPGSHESALGGLHRLHAPHHRRRLDRQLPQPRRPDASRPPRRHLRLPLGSRHHRPRRHVLRHRHGDTLKQPAEHVLRGCVLPRSCRARGYQQFHGGEHLHRGVPHGRQVEYLHFFSSFVYNLIAFPHIIK